MYGGALYSVWTDHPDHETGKVKTYYQYAMSIDDALSIAASNQHFGLETRIYSEKCRVATVTVRFTVKKRVLFNGLRGKLLVKYLPF